MGRRERRRDGKPPKQLNPLKTAHGHCLDLLSPRWIEESFTDTTKPFILDIGCGEGEWLVSAAASNSEYNYLGIEIRYEAILVAAAKYGRDCIVINHKSGQCRASCGDVINIGFLHANLLAGDLHVILNALRRSGCLLHVVAVQFPDPHWKGKHRKRRILTTSLLRTVAAHMGKGGMFYLQSDVEEVVSDVRSMLESEEGDDGAMSKGGMIDTLGNELRHGVILPDVFDISVHASIISTTEFTPGNDSAIVRAQGSYDQLRELLPSCFFDFETERASYVRRQRKPVHHMLCTVTPAAYWKSCAMGHIVMDESRRY